MPTALPPRGADPDSRNIRMIDDTGRVTTLQICPEGLLVLGVLYYGHYTLPHTAEDARRLRDYLNDRLR